MLVVLSLEVMEQQGYYHQEGEMFQPNQEAHLPMLRARVLAGALKLLWIWTYFMLSENLNFITMYREKSFFDEMNIEKRKWTLRVSSGGGGGGVKVGVRAKVGAKAMLKLRCDSMCTMNG